MHKFDEEIRVKHLEISPTAPITNACGLTIQNTLSQTLTDTLAAALSSLAQPPPENTNVVSAQVVSSAQNNALNAAPNVVTLADPQMGDTLYILPGMRNTVVPTQSPIVPPTSHLANDLGAVHLGSSPHTLSKQLPARTGFLPVVTLVDL